MQSKKRKADSDLSAEQQHALQLAEAGVSFFLTGSAGTGKSYTMLEVVKALRAKHGADDVHITGSTGVASCNVGGTTVFYFAGLGLLDRPVSKLVRILNKKHMEAVKKRWLDCKVLIIDEISMIPGQLFDKLESLARCIRRNNKPFGGIQVIVVGDFLQLPPVRKKDDAERATWCFNANTWSTVIKETILLTKIFRQDNDGLISLLQGVRKGKLTQANLKLLRSRKNKQLEEPVNLFAYRRDADKLNTQRLRGLQGNIRTFKAQDTGKAELLKGCIAPQELKLKFGASVMLLRNLDVASGLCNGTLGVVDGFTKSGDVMVCFHNGKMPLKKQTWEIKSGKQVVATRKQIPLLLAYGLTVHKAQGLSLPKMRANMRTFEEGQAYVQLSRCTDIAGVSIYNFGPASIKVNKEALAFYEYLEKKKKPEEEEDTRATKRSRGNDNSNQ